MSSAPLSERSRHWSRYWAGGALTSLPQDFAGNYDGEIAAFWSRQCEQLPDGAVVVDVCTGNGAIALLIAAAARRLDRAWEITGLDAARIDIDQLARQHRGHAGLLADVHLRGDVPFENITLADASVDLLVSQYGIEYCQWPAAASQSQRILKSGGRLALVSHAPDSDMLTTMRGEAEDYAHLERLGLLPAIASWLDGRIDAGQLRQHFGRTRRLIGRSKRARSSPLFASVMQMLDSMWRQPVEAYGRYRQPLQAFHDQMVSSQGRLLDMLRVNEAMIEADDWTEVFVEAGLERVDSGELLYRQRHRAGRFYIFNKP